MLKGGRSNGALFSSLKGEPGQVGSRGWSGEDGLKGAKVSCEGGWIMAKLGRTWPVLISNLPNMTLP